MRGLAALLLALSASASVSAPAVAAVPASVSRSVAAVPAVDDTVWDELAECESDGDWQADTGNGYFGGLQIWPPTWEEADGLAVADRPDHASRGEQIAVAEEILRQQGWEAWPSCAREIGLLEPDPDPWYESGARTRTPGRPPVAP